MKTLKKIILAAMFTAALTAFIACDNDDSFPNGIFYNIQTQRASDHRGRLYQAGENERDFEKTSCNGIYYEKYDGSGIYAVYDGCRIFAGRFGTG